MMQPYTGLLKKKKTKPWHTVQKHLGIHYKWLNELVPEFTSSKIKVMGVVSPYPLFKSWTIIWPSNSQKTFSVLDLRSGYYHKALDEESKAKSAFIFAWGKYEFIHKSIIWIMTFSVLDLRSGYYHKALDEGIQGQVSFHICLGKIWIHSQEYHLDHDSPNHFL